MRNQKNFQLTGIDTNHGTHLLEQSGNNARHAAQQLCDKYPNIWRVLSDKGNTIYTVPNPKYVPFPENGVMRAALARAKMEPPPPEPEPEPTPEPPITERKPTVMGQIRDIIIPLLPQLPAEFSRRDVENLLYAHNARELITAASVNNVLYTWAAEKVPKTVKRAVDSAGNARQGLFVVMPEARSSGRKAARKAERASLKNDEHVEPVPETKAIAPSAPVPIHAAPVDPTVAPRDIRNTSYMNGHPAFRNGNGNGHDHAQPAPPPEPETAPVVAPEPAPVPVQAAPARAARKQAAKVTDDMKVTLFSLLADGVLGSNAGDQAEFEAGMDLIMQGYDKMTRVLKRTANILGVRDQIGKMLQENVGMQ